MTMSRSFFSILILHLAAVVYAQDDQSGFISIDCGLTRSLNYTDNRSGINYVSDGGFIEGGKNHEIFLPEYNEYYSSRATTLRSFPQGERNCYTLRPKQGKNHRYLIRAVFLYGNYDARNKNPQFDLYLGADYWDTVTIGKASVAVFLEIIHLTSSDYIHVCLVNTGNGNPFISALELRLLNITMYNNPLSPLLRHDRLGFGLDEAIRYRDDTYDRFWLKTFTNYRVVKTSDTVTLGPFNEEKVPTKVMSAAITPKISSENISFMWNAANNTDKFIIYVHLAEVEKLESNQFREFNISINDKHWFGPISPSTYITTIRNEYPLTGSSNYTLKIYKTLSSTLPPIINAIEIYTSKVFQQNQTDDQDATAIRDIKLHYGLKRNWQGDPCIPQSYIWDGLNCSYKDPGAANIISLNLSSSGLSGEIASALANLTMMESLDLSFNNLTGTIPEFLAQNDNLRILNLMGNNFERPLPAELLAKSKKGLLLSIEASGDKDTSSCRGDSCKKKKYIKVVIALITLVVLLTLALIFIYRNKRRKEKGLKKEEPFTPKNQRYTYSQVQRITKNFETMIGGGGFGKVYLGYNGNNQVAVKMLSKSSAQGYKEFQTEVKLLMTVHHRNITTLAGYYNDNGHKGIIYEFMVNGNIEKHLFEGSPNVLSWERRIQIACDAAEGLAYMHHGCMPPIVHRDVKCSNILLNERFQAKIADFGLSRAFKTEDASHVSSDKIAGTRGYLDPEYYSTYRLTEKSDVYSFGVVLLELITSRRAISEGISIITWVSSMVEDGRVEKIIDPRLNGYFYINSAWKVVELAMECVSSKSTDRPTMNKVVMALKQCLPEERSNPNNQREDISLNLESLSSPIPR